MLRLSPRPFDNTFFFIHPEIETVVVTQGNTLQEIDSDLGGFNTLNYEDTDKDGMPDTTGYTSFEMAPGSLLDPDPADAVTLPITIHGFVGSEKPIVSNINVMSNIVEVKFYDSSGHDAPIFSFSSG